MSTSKAKLKKFFKAVLIFFAIILIGFLAVLIYFNAKINYYSQTLELDEKKLTSAYLKPKMLSLDGNDFSSFKFSSTVSISELNSFTKNAFISIEDKSFYSHSGINYKRIAKALLTNLKSGNFKEGASTISQQLIKNAFLSSEKSIDRKLRELALTKKLEQNYSKDEILEIYLNTIYFGNNIYGIENASKNYFNKPASELNLNESACLAGIIKSPNYFTNPNNKNALFERKNLVLKEMLKDGKITKAEFDEASIEEVCLAIQASKQFNSAYQNAVINEACTILNINEQEFLSGGFIIQTYFDETMRNCLIISIQKEKIGYNFGGIIIDNETRGILALTSNLSSFSTLSRQAGSTVKPILVYAPAIELGKFIPESFVLDEKINIDGYSPKNASGNYLGFVTLNKAVEKSLNIPAIKLFQEIGEDNCKNAALRFGINLLDENSSPSLALGSSKNGETLLNLTNAYSTLASNGIYQKPHFIKEIKDKNGIVLYSFSTEKSPAVSDETAYFTTKMLKNVAKTGTAKLLSDLKFDVASKTGTVGGTSGNKNSDAYNISYTTKHTLGVWIGSDNNENENLMPKEINGSTTPTKIMKSTLQNIYSEEVPESFKKPNGIKQINIDALEYEQNHKIVLANESTPSRYKKQVEAPSFSNFETSQNVFQNENKTLEQKVKIENFSKQFIFNLSKK